MKTSNSLPASLRRIATAALLATALESQAAPITLTDNNSTADIEPTSSAGMFNWKVDGVDQLAQQWFWYRVGSTAPEAPLNVLSVPTVSTPDARTLTTSYSGDGIGVAVTYVLSGGSPGSGASSIAETILIQNFGEIPLDFHFFQYTDLDLTGGPNSVTLSTDGGGLFNKASQSSVASLLSESVIAPGANHGEAAFFPFTLNRLNDGLATTLNDVAAAGPGDMTWALEWDTIIPAFGSFTIEKTKSIAPVPEASTWAAALAVLGIGFGGWLNRRQKPAHKVRDQS